MNEAYNELGFQAARDRRELANLRAEVGEVRGQKQQVSDQLNYSMHVLEYVMANQWLWLEVPGGRARAGPATTELPACFCCAFCVLTSAASASAELCTRAALCVVSYVLMVIQSGTQQCQDRTRTPPPRPRSAHAGANYRTRHQRGAIFLFV